MAKTARRRAHFTLLVLATGCALGCRSQSPVDSRQSAPSATAEAPEAAAPTPQAAADASPAAPLRPSTEPG
ncbi:MAG TPA: hypothetical protein VK524_20930, partial [Polyangiaceae bacterium]|nr:hypothetical protein [Polyangiaceae bacterium]